MTYATASNTCMRCKAAIPATAKFCANCGISLAAQLKSPTPFVAQKVPAKSGTKAFPAVLVVGLLTAGRIGLGWNHYAPQRPTIPEVAPVHFDMPKMPDYRFSNPKDIADANGILSPKRVAPAYAWPAPRVSSRLDTPPIPVRAIPNYSKSVKDSDDVYIYSGG